ncbi:MAG: ABC transporter permease [Candidatus Thermoplasmatota archaeon]
MSFFALVKKEIKELLTPSTILPMIITVFLFVALGNAFGNIAEEAGKMHDVGLINCDNGIFSDIAVREIKKYANIKYEGKNEEEIEKIINEFKDKIICLIFIPSNFSENINNSNQAEIEVYWFIKGLGVSDIISSAFLDNVFTSISKEISSEIIEKNGINSTNVLSPVAKKEITILKNKEIENISPQMLSNLLSSQSITIPIVMMIIIMMSGGMVISSMGMEKENKTLETLLTLPIKRSEIVAGKITGAAIVGLIMATIYMIGFSYYINSFQSSSRLNLADYGLILSNYDYLFIALSVFLALTSALAMCIVLGVFAKNYKSAQALTLPLSMLALIPMFLTMFKDFETMPTMLKIILFIIPFSHPMMAPRFLLFKNYFMVIGGIIYIAIFSLIFMIIAIKIFNTDKLITGTIRK